MDIIWRGHCSGSGAGIHSSSGANLAKPVKLTTDGVVLNPLPPPLELKVAKQVTGMLDFAEEDGLVRTILDLEDQIGGSSLQRGTLEGGLGLPLICSMKLRTSPSSTGSSQALT